jgi:protein AATF/BFR2
LAQFFFQLPVKMSLNFEELENAAPDWDPESDSETTDNDQEEQRREHYVTVGKSKMRQNLDLEMDPKYSGTRISRKELLEQEDFMSESAEIEEEEDLVSRDSQPSASEADSDNDSRQDSENDSENEFQPKGGDIKDDLLSKIKEHEAEEVQMTARLHDLAQKDAEKGVFVRNQLGIWDCLLEIRIRMQKAVEAANVLPTQHVFESLITNNDDEELEAYMEETSRDICGVIDDLIDLKKVIWF